MDYNSIENTYNVTITRVKSIGSIEISLRENPNKLFLCYEHKDGTWEQHVICDTGKIETRRKEGKVRDSEFGRLASAFYDIIPSGTIVKGSGTTASPGGISAKYLLAEYFDFKVIGKTVNKRWGGNFSMTGFRIKDKNKRKEYINELNRKMEMDWAPHHKDDYVIAYPKKKLFLDRTLPVILDLQKI